MFHAVCSTCGQSANTVIGPNGLCAACSEQPADMGGASPGRRFQRTLAAQPSSVATARGDLKAFSGDLDPAELDVAALLITELVTNSIRHAAAPSTSDVGLDIALSDTTIRVEVRDDGPGFTPCARAPDAPLESQWGLHLVDGLSDRWGVLPGAAKTVVWFEIDRA